MQIIQTQILEAEKLLLNEIKKRVRDMQLLRNNTFMCTNSEITLDVISEVFTRYLTDCDTGSFRVDIHFPFLY